MTGKKATWITLTAFLGVVFATLLLTPRFTATREALLECLRPTTVKLIPLPATCVPTDLAPPPDLLRIVEYQRRHYRLLVQQVVVCRAAASPLPDMGNLVGGNASGNDRERWLPLYVGCCAYQFRRHVAVLAANVHESGYVMVEAALVQGRWDYLRASMAKGPR